MEPCRVCAMSIVGAGIKKVVCEKRYHASRETKEIFERCGVELVVLRDEVEQYENM
jgi:dCMP deaminase